MVQDLDAACDPALTAMSKVRFWEVLLLRPPRVTSSGCCQPWPVAPVGSSLPQVSGPPGDEFILCLRSVACPLRTRQGAGVFVKSAGDTFV